MKQARSWKHVCLAATIGVMTAAFAGSGNEVAGPPMICSEIKIGEARTLALDGRGVNLVPDTLALLEAKTPVLVRMETLRRALSRGATQPAVLQELLCALQSRVLDQEARGKGDALAWFDAGYIAASWSQLDQERAPEIGLAEGCVGYAWLRKALALGKDPAEMEFAAALATHPAMHKGTHELYKRHLEKAVAGAAPGSLLEQNVKAHCENWNESYEQIKQKGGSERDAGRNR
jgi:hypothetical protein